MKGVWTVPSEVWGYRKGDLVEYTESADMRKATWSLATVLGFSAEREVYVQDTKTGKTHKVKSPHRVRRMNLHSSRELEKWLES